MSLSLFERSGLELSPSPILWDNIFGKHSMLIFRIIQSKSCIENNRGRSNRHRDSAVSPVWVECLDPSLEDHNRRLFQVSNLEDPREKCFLGCRTIFDWEKLFYVTPRRLCSAQTARGCAIRAWYWESCEAAHFKVFFEGFPRQISWFWYFFGKLRIFYAKAMLNFLFLLQKL